MRRTPANARLIDDMGGLLPTEVVALPIMHAGRAIGILYGDNAEHRAPIDSHDGTGDLPVAGGICVRERGVCVGAGRAAIER